MNSGLSFFKVISSSSSQKLDLPSATVPQLQGLRILGCRISLRSVGKKLWIVEVERGGDTYSFIKGWPQFYQDNSLKPDYVLLFTYKRDNLFDFKVFGHNACEMEGVGHPEIRVEEEAAEVEEEEDEDDDDDDYVVDDLEYEEEEIESENEEDDEDSSESDEMEMAMEEEEARNKHKSRSPSSSSIGRVREEEIEVEEEDGESAVSDEERNKKSRAKHKYSRASSSNTQKKRNAGDYYGHDIFMAGLATQPKNPYFVSRSRHSRKNELYIPNDVMLSLNLESPLKLLLVDESGRQWEAKMKKWKDRRVWCSGGWKRMCRANNIRDDDTCICELVQEGRDRVSMLVRVVDAATK